MTASFRREQTASARVPRFLLSGLVCGLARSLIFALVAGSPAAAQQKANVEGRVLTDRGVAVKSATVRLETDDGELVADSPVTTAGEFSFHFIPKKNYQLVVTAEGFQKYKERLNLGEGATDYTVTVNLTSLDKGPAAKQPPSLTDTQAPASAKHEYQKGAKALASRKFGDARKHLESAVNEYPCYARAQTDLGMLLSQQKDYKGSEAAWRKSVSCDPGYLDAYSALGALLNAEKRYDEALTILDQGVRQAPASWQFYYQMGIAQYGLKHYPEAEQQFTKAATLTPSPPGELEAKLADVYLKESQFPKAYAAMQDYLKTDPNGRLAPRIKEIMKQMQSSGVLSSQSSPPSFGPQPQ